MVDDGRLKYSAMTQFDNHIYLPIGVLHKLIIVRLSVRHI